jgi:hypothetical protein
VIRGSFKGKIYKSCAVTIAKDNALVANDRPYNKTTIEFLFDLNQERNLSENKLRMTVVRI